jgi:hypothetical protein
LGIVQRKLNALLRGKLQPGALVMIAARAGLRVELGITRVSESFGREPLLCFVCA